MMTYTIALLDGVLYGVAPDGGDIKADVRRTLNAAGIDEDEFDWGRLEIISGCTLTDEIENDDEVVYSGNRFGYLTDEVGQRYYAAVIRSAARHDA
jgi:hypothetical protein